MARSISFVASVGAGKTTVRPRKSPPPHEAKAARLANADALKLYFFVGGYISKKTRKAKWGSGAIDALSNQLQAELPGLRGFSPTSMKKMRLFFEAWSSYLSIRPLATDELDADDIAAFCSIGFSQHVEIFTAAKNLDERLYYIRACAKAPWTVEQLQ